MTRIPIGNGNEMAEERVFMGDGSYMNKRVGDVLEDEKVYLARVHRKLQQQSRGNRRTWVKGVGVESKET